MATLIRRPGSPYWFAAFDVPQADGTRRRMKRSTKKRKRSEALAEALRIEEAEVKAAGGGEVAEGKAFAIVSEAADAAARGELSEARARELIARLCELSTGQALKFYTVREWVADWLASKAATVKPASLRRYQASTGLFLEWLGERADARLEAISKRDVRAFRDAVRDGWTAPKEKKPGRPVTPPKRSGKTANHYARDIAGLFRSAVREGLLLASPAAALEKLPETDSIERATFTLAELSKLIATAGDPAWVGRVFASEKVAAADRCRDWQGVILAGFYAGMRLGDACRLKWGAIDLDKKVLTFQPGKTERKRKRLEVPIHPRLASYFAELDRPGDDDAPVFPTLASTAVSGTCGGSQQFIAIMEQAKVDRKPARDAEGGRRALYARSFHSLRHSLTSALANSDVSEEIRRRIVGHDSADVHQLYTHTEAATLARALDKLPSV